MDHLAARLTDAERALVGRFLTVVAELSERHAARLDQLLREHEHHVIAPPAPGLLMANGEPPADDATG